MVVNSDRLTGFMHHCLHVSLCVCVCVCVQSIIKEIRQQKPTGRKRPDCGAARWFRHGNDNSSGHLKTGSAPWTKYQQNSLKVGGWSLWCIGPHRARSRPCRVYLERVWKWIRVSPQGQPLLHLPEKTCVELVQRLEGGEDGVLQRVRGRLILSYGVLERLRTQKHAGLKQQGKQMLIKLRHKDTALPQKHYIIELITSSEAREAFFCPTPTRLMWVCVTMSPSRYPWLKLAGSPWFQAFTV